MYAFVISTRKNGEFQFVLKASNGQVILVSEGYKTIQACEDGVASVKLNALNVHLFERKTSVHCKHYFNLKSTNGHIIGTSEMYASVASMESGILSVHFNAPLAGVIIESNTD